MYYSLPKLTGTRKEDQYQPESIHRYLESTLGRHLARFPWITQGLILVSISAISFSDGNSWNSRILSASTDVNFPVDHFLKLNFTMQIDTTYISKLCESSTCPSYWISRFWPWSRSDASHRGKWALHDSFRILSIIWTAWFKSVQFHLVPVKNSRCSFTWFNFHMIYSYSCIEINHMSIS